MRRKSDQKNTIMNLYAWAAACLVCLFSQTGNAQSRVLLFDTQNYPSRDGLYAALRIQLADVAHVTRFGTLTDIAITDRVATASASVKNEKAMLAVWVEGPNKLSDGSSELVLYLVGERSGRAVVELLRLPAGKGPDVDRSLALKVREVVDTLILPESHHGHLLNRPEKEPSQDRGPFEPGPSLGWVYGAGVFAATQSGTRFGLWGAALDGGVWSSLSGFRIAGEVTLHLHGQIEIENEYGRVFIDETTPGIGVRGLVDYLPFAFGTLLGFQLRIVEATGVTLSGSEGDEQSVMPCFIAALDAQLDFDTVLALRIDIGLQFALRPKLYTINNRELAELGPPRPFAQLGVVFWDR